MASAASSSIVPPSVSRAPIEEGAQCVTVQGFETEQGGSAEKRAVDLEERVLGRGAHQGEGAVLDTGEKGVLLGLGEPVDLVEQQDGRYTVVS